MPGSRFPGWEAGGLIGGGSPPTGLPQSGASLPSGPTQPGVGAFGTVPTVPSPAGTQQQAIAGNVGNLGQLYGLTGSLNTQIANQAALPYQLNLPNYGAMLGSSSGNILSQLRGQVPQDVSNQLQQMAAERGIATGSIGSPNANAALLRSLGLTSLGLQQQGEQNLTGAIGRTPTGQQFNPQSFLFTPGQQQEAQYGANVLGAAPDPTAAGQLGLQTAQQGLGFGLGTGGISRGGGGFGQVDALGFPIDNFMAGGMGGPAEQVYGALGTPYQPAANPASAWNTWNQGMPWNQPQSTMTEGDFFGDTSGAQSWYPGVGNSQMTEGEFFGDVSTGG